jgi:hypothetical protein
MRMLLDNARLELKESIFEHQTTLYDPDDRPIYNRARPVKFKSHDSVKKK